MTLRDEVLPIIDAARSLIQDFGLRQTRVFRRNGQWDGGEIHLGNLTNTDTEILPRPKVEDTGRGLKVSKVTPSYGAGGFTPEQLRPSESVGLDHHYLVIKPDGTGRPYFLAECNFTKNFGYELALEPLDRDQPGF